MPIHLQQGNLIECHLPTNKWRMHHSVVKNKNYHHVPLSAFFAAVTKVAPQFRICVRHIIHFFSRLMTEKKNWLSYLCSPCTTPGATLGPPAPCTTKKTCNPLSHINAWHHKNIFTLIYQYINGMAHCTKQNTLHKTNKCYTAAMVIAL